MKRFIVLAALTSMFTLGCGSPNRVNVELRKKNQDLQTRVDFLENRHNGDQATIASLQQRNGAVQPTLPTTRMAELFTVTAIEINKLTGFRKEGLKVYVQPTDADGDVLKSAGGLVIEAYELGRKDEPLLGRWEFPVKDAGVNWYASWVVTGYALTVPLSPPAQPTDITVRATFTDALTQRTFTAQRVIKTEAQTNAPETP